MPLFAPGSAPSVRVIYAECNSPATGSQDGTPGYLFDTFYDMTMADITSGRVAALAALGLTHDDATGIFTVTTPSVWSVGVSLLVDNSPGGDCTVSLSAPNYGEDSRLVIPNPNTLPPTVFSRIFTANTGAGDPFTLRSVCANGSDTPFSYAVLEIIRLV